VLVTFKTTAYADIVMFADAAQSLLKLMGQSGNVPGAIMGEDVADALDQLQNNLKNHSEPEQPDANAGLDADEESNRVALATRAVPLIELLEAAKAATANVMWDE
jgi:hypothetical protein